MHFLTSKEVIMKISKHDLERLQNKLKVGNKRGVHLNAITGRARLKFDITRLSAIKPEMPQEFINALLSKSPLNFKISWKDNIKDINTLSEEEQINLYKVNTSLNNLVNDVQAIESEKGINTFGFGFPLVIRQDQKDNKITVAPLIIWSLQIVRSNELNTWYIKRTEDNYIHINEVLINHLQSDSNIILPEISDDYLENGLINTEELLTICVDVAKCINSSNDDNLKQIFADKLFNIKSIADKAHYEKLPLSASNSLIEFAGLFSLFSVSKHNIINDYDSLLTMQEQEICTEDLENNHFQSISSVETDPSQQGILTALKKSRNIIIQGPPGTGKSQTLTAVLVNALENHKKTMVVCEKRTALEVLEKTLINKGLSEQVVLIKDFTKDRRQVVDNVRERVDYLTKITDKSLPNKQALNNIINSSQDLINSINNKHKKLAEKLLDNKNWTDIVGELLATTKVQNKTDELEIDPNLFDFTSQEFTNLLDTLVKGYPLNQQYIKTKPYSYLNTQKLLGNNQFQIEQEIKTAFKQYQYSLNSIYKQAEDYKIEYYQIRNQQLEEQTAKLQTQIDKLNHIFNDYEEDSIFYDENTTRGIFFRFFALFMQSKKQVLESQQQVYDIYQNLIELSNNCEDYSEIEIAEDILEIQNNIKKYKDIIQQTKINFTDKITREYDRLNLLQVYQPPLKTAILNNINQEIKNLKNQILNDNWCVNVSFDMINNTHDEVLKIIKDIINKHNIYNQQQDDLFTAEFEWINFYYNLSDTAKLIIDELIPVEDWQNAFKAFYLTQLLIKYADNNLPTNDNDIHQLNIALKDIEKQQLSYIKNYWTHCQINAIKHFNDTHNFNVEQLYSKRKTKNHNRLSLREIIKIDKELFTAFFPIILTTPEVASNLFDSSLLSNSTQNNQRYFDIIMFDEASQLKVEDNLPSLLKGKQIIIAGDEHQMPPSNYFAKSADITDNCDEDGNEEELISTKIHNSIFDSESLLEFATIELDFPKCYLDFHYRSQHPYLIDFSNFAFYNQRLKPLPNKQDYVPIKYINVNGIYTENTNQEEAIAVLDIIANNIQLLENGNYPTVGIATFNIKQRDYILNLINERRECEEYKEFNEKITELESNGFFVKNLENIQGDERDIIILSTTYGQNTDGKFYQKFGSLNHQKGYKLLNVIITRAKYKVYVCSSIPENQFLNYHEYLKKEQTNNRRAVFYAYLAYAKAVSEQDENARQSVLNALAENTNSNNTDFDNVYTELESPFEEEVYQALVSSEGIDNEKIYPQLRFAGFRIDMVYDFKKPNIPKIAIECDGAKYHSSQEAYLHDRYRQKILEQHGFVFHRIWSTNWWRNPKKETHKLVEFIKSIENNA